MLVFSYPHHTAHQHEFDIIAVLDAKNSIPYYELYGVVDRYFITDPA